MTSELYNINLVTEVQNLAKILKIYCLWIHICDKKIILKQQGNDNPKFRMEITFGEKRVEERDMTGFCDVSNMLFSGLGASWRGIL